MLPSLVAEDLRSAISTYLTTSFALGDDDVRDELGAFLERPESRLFRGPFLRVRAPFREALRGWQRHLDWWPKGFSPYTHQATAWERLTTKNDHRPQPTIVTTGTGSGKTESFLVPILDHCARARAAGQAGVKALLLYPMNALADDQAGRIDKLLRAEPALKDVTAGIYIGGKAGKRSATDEDENSPGSYARETGASAIVDVPGVTRLITDREAIRNDPPDILLTNYKMLDLLLQRVPDVPLWQGRSLTYIVLDEFHTYDGAQGTDVAMLLRRLGAATGFAEEGRPLGSITPIATSATLGGAGLDDDEVTDRPAAVAKSSELDSDGSPVVPVSEKSDRQLLLEFAEKVFGTPFDADALIGEDRMDAAAFIEGPDFLLPDPSPADLAAISDPLDNPSAMDKLARCVLGIGADDPLDLGTKLRQHKLTKAILDVAGGEPVEIPEVAREFAKRGGGAAWVEASREDMPLVVTGLSRILALISAARSQDPETGRLTPFLRVEAQLWIREVRRVIRAATPEPHFRWFDDDGPTGDSVSNRAYLAVYESEEIDGSGNGYPDHDDQDLERVAFERPVGYRYRMHLPAVYCRHCGRSGWAVLSTDLEWQQIKTKPLEIYQAAAQHNRPIRWMLRARHNEHTAIHLHAEEGELRFTASRESVPVITPRGPVPDDNGDKCPSCELDDGMRFLGAGTATLASVTTTQLFSDRGLGGTERKLLVFTDSVQDATHRAAFIANRSFSFSFRGLLTFHLGFGYGPIAVHDLATDAASAVVGDAGEGDLAKLASIVPPDLREDPDIRSLFASEGAFTDAGADMLQARLIFQTLLEFGLRSRLGRTLELTRTAAAEVRVPEPAVVCAMLRDAHQRMSGQIVLPTDDEQYLVYLRGLLERMRLRGAIFHPWLRPFIEQAGARRWPVWGGRPTGMPAFPRGLAAPTFPITGRSGATGFDSLNRDGTWFVDWGLRSLGLGRNESRELAGKAMQVLAQRDFLSTFAAEGGSIVFALKPRNLLVHSLVTDGVAVNDCGVRCDTCTWRQTVPPTRQPEWLGTPCLRFQCPGRFIADDRDYTKDYYRHLYSVDRPGDVLTAEHTGALSRERRERIEAAFRDRPSPFDPNVLTCTPTLELGIDIGDLSSVLLASLPPAPANYAQRVGRAGRQTGNSFTVTFVPRGARNQYYLHAPKQMLAGRIIPPDCYLDASEILRRQYLAFLLDRAADRSLWENTAIPEQQMPHRIGELFRRGLADDGWFRRFLDVAQARNVELARRFIALFPTMSPETKQAVQFYAADGLEKTVGAAALAWRKRHEALQARMRQIGRAFDALASATGDRERDAQRRQLFAEQRSVRARRDALVAENSINAMVRLGLLPNYTLHDDATLLDATLWWKDATGEFHDEPAEYGRGSRLALSELAPGNSFHTDGYKYVINGLDLGGGAGRSAYVQWRLCPECGFVATEETGLAITACPRCGTPRIADPGAVHTVLVPERVTARERREDARLTDERDEREQRFYDIVTLVDIDPDQPQGLRAWKRVGDTTPFGVEFARVATIRTLNVGQRGVNGPQCFIAGDEWSVSGFETCPECGSVQGAHPQAWNRAAGRIGTRHAFWCSHRDDGVEHEPTQKLILAHELTTQALRILLPFSHLDLDRRLVSFKAALLLGITRYFGGAPDHIRVVQDSMPGGAEELRRRFLVLHDSMPGGTGYLEHLAAPKRLHAVLRLAYETVRDCPCQNEPRQPCHRCLLPHVSSNEHPHVSRQVARDLLEALLDGWATESVDTLTGVRIDQLADSELEAKFVRTLEQWGARVGDTASAIARAGVRGVEHEIRFTPATGDGTRWRFQDHVRQLTVAPSEPDYLLTRIDGPPTRIAVFLDGFSFHASAGVNRIADDAEKRKALRAAGTLVWQFTWEDVNAWAAAVDNPAGGTLRPAQADPLLGDAAMQTARQIHQMVVGEARPDDTMEPVFRNPIETLLAFLADPDSAKWMRRASALLAGFGAQVQPVPIDREALGQRLPGILAGGSLPSDADPTRADVQAIDASTLKSLRVLGFLDGRRRADRQLAMTTWSAFAVLDDSDAAVAEPGHHDRWSDWLRWSNLLQFLDGPSRFFDQVAVSAAGGVDPHAIGLLASAMPTTTGAAIPQLPRPWADAVKWASPLTHDLLFQLAQHRPPLPVPEVGYEVLDGKWQVELAWESARIAIVVDVNEVRDAELESAGWTVMRPPFDLGTLIKRLEDS